MKNKSIFYFFAEIIEEHYYIPNVGETIVRNGIYYYVKSVKTKIIEVQTYQEIPGTPKFDFHYVIDVYMAR